MIMGRYREGRTFLPRVLHISIARYSKALPKSGEDLKFLVSIHEEGTGITWQQNVTVGKEDESYLLDTTHELYLWSFGEGLDPQAAQEHARQLGAQLYKIFIGEQGEKILTDIRPTAILLNVDETMLNLPWELIGVGNGSINLNVPFGRLVTTRTIPQPVRDPTKEDMDIRILAVANPTLDLTIGEREINILRSMNGTKHMGSVIKVDELVRGKATRPAFSEMVAGGNYDIIHFSGHGSFNSADPEMSAIRFADGMMSTEDILDLKWDSPPYLVFNSACESGRAAGGKRLVSKSNHSNGLAAAFLTKGVSAYAGFFWPVTETGAERFAEEFYRQLFERENVGIAFCAARQRLAYELALKGDLTAYSAILFGDAASEHRRDLGVAK